MGCVSLCRPILHSPHLLWVAVACLVVGCATHSGSIGAPQLDSVGFETSIRDFEQDWRGTPYRDGGATAEGIDGANFVALAFGDRAGVSIPNNVIELLDLGVAIPQQELRTGDLVFFQPPGASRHVGIYLRDGEFAHASPNAGVTISRMEENYWTRAYWTARRIIDDPGTVTATPEAQESTPTRTKRIGW